jgi:hypothetical protein
MSQRHERRNREDTLIGTDRVEPESIRGSCDAGKGEANIGRSVIFVQDVDLFIDLAIGNVTALQGIILGDDMDYVDPGDQHWVLRRG